MHLTALTALPVEVSTEPASVTGCGSQPACWCCPITAADWQGWGRGERGCGGGRGTAGPHPPESGAGSCLRSETSFMATCPVSLASGVWAPHVQRLSIEASHRLTSGGTGSGYDFLLGCLLLHSKPLQMHVCAPESASWTRPAVLLLALRSSMQGLSPACQGLCPQAADWVAAARWATTKAQTLLNLCSQDLC